MAYSRIIARVGNASKKEINFKRRKLRKGFMESKKQWENEWWEKKIVECNAAEQKNGCNEMHIFL